MEQLANIGLDGIIPGWIVPKDISGPVAAPLGSCLWFCVLQLAVMTSIIESILVDSFISIKLLFGRGQYGESGLDRVRYLVEDRGGVGAVLMDVDGLVKGFAVGVGGASLEVQDNIEKVCFSHIHLGRYL